MNPRTLFWRSTDIHCRRGDRVAVAIILGLTLLAGAGCQNFNNPAPDSLAAVTIENKSVSQITEATEAVFTAHSFQGGPSGANQFTFTRPASRMDDLAYGNFVEGKITLRVRVNLDELGAGATVVSCNAKLVEDIGGAVFQDVHKVGSFGKGPYQDLLNEIQLRLK